MQSPIIFILALLSVLGLAVGNRVNFINKDSADRVICWYAGAVEGSDPNHPVYYPQIPGTFVKAHGRGVTPEIVHGGQYMFKSVHITTGEDGKCENYHNVEGEVKFNGKNGLTWFDLSVVKLNEVASNQREHKTPIFTGFDLPVATPP